MVHYVYDSAGRLIAEHDGATGAAIAEYVWLGGAPLAYVRDGQTFWVHGDHLGTPQLLTDGAGRIAWSAIYRPFGETAHVGGQVTFNLRFPGQYYDAETGLHYNYHRDYDPSLGRYVQSDPIGLRGGWNTYAYVGGNPVMRVDPEGLDAGREGTGGFPVPAPPDEIWYPGSPANQQFVKDVKYLNECYVLIIKGIHYSIFAGLTSGLAAQCDPANDNDCSGGNICRLKQQIDLGPATPADTGGWPVQGERRWKCIYDCGSDGIKVLPETLVNRLGCPQTQNSADLVPAPEIR